MMTEKDRTIAVHVALKEAGADMRSNPDYVAGIVEGGDVAVQWRNVAAAHAEWWIELTLAHCERVASFADTAAASQALQTQMGAQPVQVGGMAPPPQQTFAAPPQPQYAPQAAAPQAQAYAQPQYAPQPQQGFTPPQQGFAPQPPQVGTLGPQQQWESLLNEPANWRDVRGQKRGPNSPDYVHAWMKGSNGKDIALWLNGNYNKPPQHILQALQMQGRA